MVTKKAAAAKEVETPFQVGDLVIFKDYTEAPPDDEKLLVPGETYTVSEVNAEESSVSIEVPNPDFNPRKKESDTNPKTYISDVFFEEVELAGSEEADDDDVAEDDEGAEEVEEAAPAPRGRAPAKTVAAVTTKAAPAKATAAKAAPAKATTPVAAAVTAKKPAAKVAATTKAAPASAKAVAAGKGRAAATATKGKLPVKAEKEEPVDPYAALETEDEEMLALINETEDILELAQELTADSAALEYKLGGVLYHIRLSKAYQTLDDRYKENGGFGLYVKEKLNVEYRMAMYLLDIYYKFNLYGIDAATVQQIGWTKSAKIAAVMNDENAEELVEVAGQSTVSELNDTIKESYRTTGATGGVKRRKVAFKFRLWEDQAAAVEEVLKDTGKTMGMASLDDVFEHIVMEWAAEHDIGVSAVKASKVVAKAKAAPATTGATTGRTKSAPASARA